MRMTFAKMGQQFSESWRYGDGKSTDMENMPPEKISVCILAAIHQELVTIRSALYCGMSVRVANTVKTRPVKRRKKRTVKRGKN